MQNATDWFITSKTAHQQWLCTVTMYHYNIMLYHIISYDIYISYDKYMYVYIIWYIYIYDVCTRWTTINPLWNPNWGWGGNSRVDHPLSNPDIVVLSNHEHITSRPHLLMLCTSYESRNQHEFG
jgi:hypothetical protein